MDRRLWPATGRVAHVSLRGVVDAAAFTEGETRRVGRGLVDLRRAIDGPLRERQLWMGEAFTVVDRDRGFAFGFSARDGYCGWLPEEVLTTGGDPTHWVASSGTHLYAQPRVQDPFDALPFGAQVEVTGHVGKYAEVKAPLQHGGSLFVPASHLRPIRDWLTDPVTVAEGFLGTPYLWGGNSRAGIDCSGLVQAAYLACGVAIPGDSDLQETVGAEGGGDLRRGDLLFWKGHVALVVDGSRLIHANGHSMSVAYEGIAACIARIEAAEGLTRRSHRRL